MFDLQLCCEAAAVHAAWAGADCIPGRLEMRKKVADGPIQSDWLQLGRIASTPIINKNHGDLHE
ncbi:hypothetical protein LBW87_16710 [Herbaspirillum seropedicae]|nr:hypothetical protein [Herbaspirillum sp. alder98]